jgi:putative redox protein
MGIVAQRHEINLSGSTLRIEKHMTSTPVRRIAKLVVDIHMKGQTTPEQRQMLERAGHACPVHRSLHPDIEIPITFTWE